MENSYSGAVDKAKKALKDIKSEVKLLDVELQKAVASVNVLISSTMPSKATEQLKQRAAAVTKVTDVTKQLDTAIQKSIELNAKNQNAIQGATKEESRRTEQLKRAFNASEKLSGAYNKLIKKENQAKDALRNLIAEGKKGTETQKQYNKRLREAQTAFNKVRSRANQARKAVSNFNNTGFGGLLRSARSLISAFGIIGGATLFAGLVKDAFNLTKKLDSMGFSMKAVITDARELGQTQVWLRDIAEKYGAELVTVTNRYIKFRAAAAQANFTAQETQNIFGTMTKAAGVLGLKTDELQGVFLALEQMISKGKITTEELRRQLGERLPGAMDIMAKSMGVTTAQLDDLLKKGKVITKDVLPAFAEQVEIAFGLNSVQSVETLQAATSRLKNAWTILIEDFNKSSDASGTLMNIINSLARNLGTLVSVLIKGVIVFGTYKAAVVGVSVATSLWNKVTKISIGTQIKSTISSIKDTVAKITQIAATKGLTVATGYASAAMWAFTRSLLVNPIFLTIGALTALYFMFQDTAKGARELTDEFIENQEEALKERDAFNEITNSAEELFDRYNELTKKQEDLKDGTKLSVIEQNEFEKIIAKIGGIMPDVITKVNEYSVATDINTQAVLDNLAARNIETGNTATKDAIENQKELKKLEDDYKEFQATILRGEGIEVEVHGKTMLLGRKKGEAIRKISGNSRDANDFEIKAFNGEDARFQRQIRRLTNLRDANQDIAFDKLKFFEEETAGRRKKEAEEEKEAKRVEDEFNATKSLVAKKKAIVDAEIAMVEFLNVEKISLEKDYTKAVAEATGNVTQLHEKTFIELKENIKKAKKDLDDFTEVKGKKKDDSAAAKAAREAEREAERLLKARLKFDQEALKSNQVSAQARLKTEMDNNQAILDDEEANVIKKSLAGQDYEKAANDSAESIALFEIAMATLSAQFIIDSLKTTEEEKERARANLIIKTKAINDKLDAVKNKNHLKGLDNIEKIFSEEFEKKKKHIEDLKALEEGKGDVKVIEAQTKFEDDLKKLNTSFKNKEISQTNFDARLEELTQQHEDNINKIKRESAIKQILAQIDLWEKLVKANPTLSDDEKNEALENLSTLRKQLSDATLENELANIETEAEARQRLLDLRTEIISTASSSIAEALNLDADHLNTFLLDIADGFGSTTEEILQTIANTAAVVGDIIGAVHERNIEQLDEQIQANSDYYTAILDNDLLSEEQRSAIEAERDAKEAVLEKKKRREKTKAAKADKAAAIVQAIISTSLAILKVTEQTGVIAPLLIPGIIALGAAQIGAILATPIPKFEKGTMSASKGLALVDEKRPEVHTDRFGNIKSFGGSEPNLRYLEQGDKIYPSHDDFFNYGQMDDIQKAVWQMNGVNTSPRTNDQVLSNEINKMVTALNNKKLSFRMNQKIELSDDLNFMYAKNDTL